MASGGVVGVLVGCAAGFVVAFVQANLSHRLTANQFVVGLALNVLVLGLTAYLDTVIDLPRTRAPVWRIPVLADLPLARRGAVRQAMARLPRLRPRARLCGGSSTGPAGGSRCEPSASDPQAADVSGIDVNARRRQAIYLCGLTSGFGGAFLVLGQVDQFQPNIVNGRGLHRHRRRDLRRLDAARHGRRLHPVRVRRGADDRDSRARLRDRPVDPRRRALRRRPRRDAVVRHHGSASRGPSPNRSSGG